MKKWLKNAFSYLCVWIAQILVFVVGNLWRLTVCNLSNLTRFIYDRIRLGNQYGFWKQQAWTGSIDTKSRYEFDGFTLFGIRFKWPTYVRCIAAFAENGFAGNCDCFAHAVRATFCEGRVRIFVVGLNIFKVHYLFEFRDLDNKYVTHDLTQSGPVRSTKSARAVMEERHPDKTVYTVW